MPSTRISGSFRDPSGYVFERDGRLFRAVDAECHAVLESLAHQQILKRLLDDGVIVGTRFVDDPALLDALRNEHPGSAGFLEHDILPQISYPYEWTVSMLADAAVHTLELQTRLVTAGYGLKDASAYNIQFVEGKPVFIDIASIERPARLDLWYALGQLQRMFLYPLLLCTMRGWDLRSCFLSRLDGISLQEMGRSFGWLERLRPALLLDIGLPLLMEQHGSSKARLKPGQDAGSASQLFNLQRLRGKIHKLASSYKPQGSWAGYTGNCSYSPAAERSKKDLIRDFLQRERPAKVLDLGCNTGDYSFLAAACGAEVVATDADHDAVESLYRRLKTMPQRITPLVLDITNPSPAIGHLNVERRSFLQRVDSDCVMALALLHHLLVSANLSLEASRDLLWQLTRKHLILEFVPPQDVMFQKLLQFRRDLFDGLSLEKFLNVFSSRFELLAQIKIEDSPRTLLFFARKA